MKRYTLIGFALIFLMFFMGAEPTTPLDDLLDISRGKGSGAKAVTIEGHTINADAAAPTDLSILYNPDPSGQLTNFNTYQTYSMFAVGANSLDVDYNWVKFTGPGILKLQTLTDTADCDVSGGLDLITIPNNV